MEIDAAAKAALITRTVDEVDRDGRPARRTIATRTFATSIDDLWDALTNAERLPRWFLPVSGDLVVGGNYQLEGNAGGRILACDPPTRFEITWEYGGEVSWVTVTLAGAGDGQDTELSLVHVGHTPPEFWDQYGPGATGVGWDLALIGLDLHLSSGTDLDPAELRGWESTPAARAYITASAEAWGAASVAGGADPDAAAAAAARTLAFYTGEPA